jgi:hypothetical protein
VLLGAAVLANCTAQAEPRYIRLRHGIIDTSQSDRPAAAAQPAQGARAASGLYLVQFRDHLQPAWRAALAAQRIELLQYVPDDAFVVRLDGVSLRELRALPFVRWVGEYKPEHKLHGRVQAALAGAQLANHALTVLLSPLATPEEIDRTRGAFQAIHQQARHRFGIVIRGVVPGRFLQSLADSPAVLWIEPAPNMKLVDELSSKIVGGDCEGHASCTQQLGFDGAGVRVAVADSGLDTGMTNDMHPDLAGRVAAFYFYGNLTNAADYHGHGTHVAGIVAGNGATGEVDESGELYGLGVAAGATIIAQRIFDGDGGYEAPRSFEVLTHDAVRAGADIGNNSWGDETQGRYDVSAAEFDALVRDADTEALGDQEYFLEFSAGNAGPADQSMYSPAVAKNVIATGASENNRIGLLTFTEGQEAMGYFSSRGPAEDGRIKPDVVAPGTWIASLRSQAADEMNIFFPISPNYMFEESGTSFAGPHVSGAAAVFVQYFVDTYAIGKPSPALIKAALINSAVDMQDEAGTPPTPNMEEGWGRVDLTEIIGSELSHDFIDQTNLLATDQVYERQIIIRSTEHPFKVTLAYTDFPGFPAVLPALVNDLDLEVIGPDGRVYRGNQFDLGESVPDAPANDNLNNVECVRISVPLAGEYRVRVTARNVAQDSRLDTLEVDQDFALVISGDILPPEAGVVLLDRSAYRAPSQIKVKLYDADLMGQTSALVVVASATEMNGEPLLLQLQPDSGAFTGSVATALGSATADGRLQIAHGDWIRAQYFDVVDNTNRFASATADLRPPVISLVSITNRFGQTILSWITDEPANAVVRFNTNSSLLRTATNSVLTTTHAVELTNLVVGRTYYFVVESTDVAGNTTTTNHNGVPYSFVAQPTATVLLVNNYIPDTSGASELIPVSTYANALEQNRISYDLWNAGVDGAALPGFTTLRPYPVVIWRINDSFYRTNDSIPTVQQNAIQQYLNGGGAFFMASMEILSRLGTVPFRTNVLFCQSFLQPSGGCVSCDENVGVAIIEGETADPIGRNILATLDYSHYPAIEEVGKGPDLSDTFGPHTNAAPMIFDLASGKPCGIRYPRTGQDSTGRVVFCSFPLDAIPESGLTPNNRANFLHRVLQFLAPGSVPAANIAFDQAEYTLPDLVTVEVSDADLAGGPGPLVRFHSDTDTDPIAITLQETPTPGLFRGFIPLVSATNAPETNVLRALHGQRIYAEYFDDSSAEPIAAEAEIDSVPPSITSGIFVTPSYEEARISWSTDEPTDALVQFGESTFLGRTAYDPEFALDHELKLTSLVPDRVYYFQVVSRDPAGNARVDDNATNLYFFRTLPPEQPPFGDNMDSLSTLTNWSVCSDDRSESQWQLGFPHNGVETAAHSPPNCWGSCLYDGSFELIDTSLISPAIELTGGNVATLRFWHQYDFSDLTSFDYREVGELNLYTNSLLSSPVLLLRRGHDFFDGEFGLFSNGWEEENIDLTPYVGRIIFLVWHHQLLSLESAPRAGWLVDDVSVVMSNVPPVTIEITNNLAQARYLLSGPISRSGQGYRTLVTNAPPGTYRVTFNPVPYYQTPSPQTNTLPEGATATFSARYTFPDANRNDISDIWELQYFGSTNNHPGTIDSDGDGFKDYSEFIAGTNPTLPNSSLRVTSYSAQADGMILMQWPSVAGRIYQVQGTTDFVNWTPLSSWIQAAAGMTSFSPTNPATGPPRFYRIEVRP